jgi:uncharacterized protein (TIGR00251 family)
MKILHIHVKVHPRSRRQSIEMTGPGEYEVRVFSPAEKGQANGEMIRLIAAHFGLPPSRVRIVRGEKARRKQLALHLKGDDSHEHL